MKVTGETFSFKNEKRSRRSKIPQVSKLLGKRTVTGQNSGELYNKKHRWGNSKVLGKYLTESTLLNYFLIIQEESFR